MRQILENLVGNALRYAITELKLSLKILQENENEALYFADNGNGVSLEKIPHLFKQVDPSSVHKTETKKHAPCS
ncbi:sensor histidine kinase [Paenibacillus thalictri]|uniref:ATP-binding protein n=1 Tax=Paenibacillus thalictri TaxID=2527873 RepID=A0A4Q9DFI7_9BACL|nr:ATP-binding protein [Paenibacillus thalictri]